MLIDLDTLVDDVMSAYPATIRTFLDFKMACVGCPVACFHTVSDACGHCGQRGAGQATSQVMAKLMLLEII